MRRPDQRKSFGKVVTCSAALFFAVVPANLALAQDAFIDSVAPNAYRVEAELRFNSASGPRTWDLYLPAHKTNAPVVIIYNGFATPGLKGQVQRAGWAHLLAASGFAVVDYDSGPGGSVADFDSVTLELRRVAAKERVDASRLAVLAWSGHASEAWGVIMDTARKDIVAAAIYYGTGRFDSFRLDLPLLVVRAGLDTRRLNTSLDEIIRRGLAANAPLTVVNNGGGYHGFDIFQDDAFSRSIVRATAEFLRAHMERGTLDAIAERSNLARAAGMLYAQDTAAASAYAKLVSENPNSATLKLRLGEALTVAGRYMQALDVFDELRGSTQVGQIDLAYPAARAAAAAGSFARAEPWLKTLLQRGFTKERLREDPNLIGLHKDPEFLALTGP